MRLLGLDLGTKTLGLALSDTTGMVATPYKTVRYNNYDELMLELLKIIDEYNIKTLVLGLPKNMNNTVGPRGEETLNFKELLEQELNIEVVMQDERLSTVSAENVMIKADISRKKRKEKIDSLAATIILQTYLDRKER